MNCNMRKSCLLVILIIAAALLTQGCAKQQALVFDNASFYDAQGNFNVEAGKDAYIRMMKYHGYPVFPGLREGLWVSDYGLGQFTKLEGFQCKGPCLLLGVNL